jgi:hypothetical protein
VIFVDPLTGKPTTPPRPAAENADGQPSERSSEDADPGKPVPRVRVIVGNGGSGEPGGSDSMPRDRFAPPVASVSQSAARKPASLRPAWVHGGRDWTIFVECRADALVLYPSQRQFALAQVMGDGAGNPLVQAIEQMIQRRQTSRRPGEPPYHPQVCLLVRPENVRTFLRIYRSLEALSVPITRRNLDPSDDVISIVTGAIP